jgi:hypothetical protein
LCAPACLTREVVNGDPTTKSSIVAELRAEAVDKIDLLLAIDNSASMRDKQRFLAQAVPDLVGRLVSPRCLTEDGRTTGRATKFEDPAGQFGCPEGTLPEFPPIADIHVAVVTSSMGTFGSMYCEGIAGGEISDRAHLIARARDERDQLVATPPMERGNYFAWFPETAKNRDKPNKPAAPYTDPKRLTEAVQQLVRGAGESGCGAEMPLESVFRFLNAPDPYESVVTPATRGGTGKVEFRGLDQELLAQRAAFLRPDSLVAIVMLTDEDDVSLDPGALGGNAGYYLSNNFPGGKPRSDVQGRGTTAARGTRACETDPGSVDCMSCAVAAVCTNPDCLRARKDENCRLDPYFNPEDDLMDVRFHRMRRRFGAEPRYPIRRYVDGLRSPVVPQRSSEHDGDRAFRNDCTNPLFAARLPHGARPGKDRQQRDTWIALGADGEPFRDAQGREVPLCELPRGSRDRGLVFFAAIAGAPNDLLTPERLADGSLAPLGDATWTALLGRDPEREDETGQDPRMLQSVTPRPGRPSTGPDASPDDPDNKTARDWDTRGADLQYACTFPLPATEQRPPPAFGTDDYRLYDCKKDSDAPLCEGDKASTTRRQVRAKAFPARRELMLVRALGDQGTAASICPRVTTPGAPDYGYGPAVNSIVDRLGVISASQCLPRALTRDADGTVSCSVLQILEEDTCAARGLKDAPADLLAQSSELRDKLGRVCVVPQLASAPGASCREGDRVGWCYVNGQTPKPGRAARCAQAIEFHKDAILPGARALLQCIDQRGSGT